MSETASEKAMNLFADSIEEIQKADADINVRLTFVEEKQCICESVNNDILDQARVEMQEI